MAPLDAGATTRTHTMSTSPEAPQMATESAGDGTAQDAQTHEQTHEERLEELEQIVEDQASRIQYLEENTVPRTAMNHLISALVGDGVPDFSADPFEYRHLVEDFNDRVNDVEGLAKRNSSKVDSIYDGSVDGPEAAWIQIIEAAKNLQNQPNHGLPNNRVQLYKENIAQATGKSDRQAGNYIERFGEEKEGTDWKPYKRPSQSPDGKNKEAQKKRLVVDLDVWGDADD